MQRLQQNLLYAVQFVFILRHAKVRAAGRAARLTARYLLQIAARPVISWNIA